MRHFSVILLALTLLATEATAGVFRGRDKFDLLVRQAETENWPALPLGERTATVGRAMTGVPYRSYTLEVDDRVETPVVNLEGMDCWTFFENALSFSRMLAQPRDTWTPEAMLQFVELDRYRGGQCTGEYLSRLHYLEDWLGDNDRRGLLKDLTRSLGAKKYPHQAREMTIGWRQYRYLRANPSLLAPLGRMESRVTAMPLYGVPKNRVAGIESKLQNGDVIGIISRDGNGLYSTSHVGLAARDAKGTLRFMHASSPNNHGRVLMDDQLSRYLQRYPTHAAILVARPVK